MPSALFSITIAVALTHCTKLSSQWLLKLGENRLSEQPLGQ